MKRITQTRAFQVCLMAMLAMFAGVASATTIPGTEGFGAAFTELQSSAGDMIADAWPVLIAITGGLILMKVGKKVMNRAT